MVEDFGFIEDIDQYPGNVLLRLVVKENNRPILGTHIRSLSVERGRIMYGKEHFQNFFAGGLVRIINDLNRFSMTGLATANFPVGWMG
mgnify:CR=1 FL=1